MTPLPNHKSYDGPSGVDFAVALFLILVTMGICTGLIISAIRGT